MKGEYTIEEDGAFCKKCKKYRGMMKYHKYCDFCGSRLVKGNVVFRVE